MRPMAGESAFLPRTPFLPPGFLREVLVGSGAPLGAVDADLLTALRAVGLTSLADRPAALDARADWRRTLSTGDQQRLALARLLVSNPRYVFLDHVTESLRSVHVSSIYEALRAASVVHVSFGDASLARFHDEVLTIDEHGAWRVDSAPETPEARTPYAS